MGIKRAYPAAAEADSGVDLRCGAPELTTCNCKRSRLWSSSDYEETGQLGQGAYGRVVEARLRCTGATFAVKKPLRCTHQGDDGVTCACSNAHMLREAAFLAACHGHPGFVQLRAISHDALTGKLSLVMDCVGPSLYDVLHEHRRSQPFTEAETRCIMRQLLGGAEHMHGHRVIHRDIKPENILVGRGGIDDVKICDLGLALSMYEPPPYGKRGTYRYMAPEMILGQTDYDGMVDMWSLGCVMAELITGKPVFDAEGGDAKEEAETLLAIFRVLGVPLFTTWPAYSSLPLAGKLVKPPHVIPRNKLRQYFPVDILSEVFEVLQGLLTYNIEKRLSATAALGRPWFTNATDDNPA